MSREIVINKYEGNTVYSVSVFDSYGVETHLGYLHHTELDKLIVNDTTIREHSELLWANEVKPEENLLSNAIGECIKLDEERGVEPNLD
tara:strand:+ start:105 stop:371 length:267 start_codon:yes stop_codon:yes gene_type:complete